MSASALYLLTIKSYLTVVMKTALITGANKSIGFEIARQFAQKGLFVYLGSRDLENGLEAVRKLKAEGLDHVEAVNMYTIALAYELRETTFKVNAVDPGLTKTDLNNHRGTGSVEVAGKRIVKYALIGEDGPTGRFFSEETNPKTGEIPW